MSQVLLEMSVSLDGYVTGPDVSAEEPMGRGGERLREWPAAGLALLDEVSDRLGPSHRPIAVRAHLLEMAGEIDAAVSHYRTAARRATSIPEQRHLAMRAARMLQSRDAAADVETERLAPLLG